MENIDICAGASSFIPKRSISFCRVAGGGQSQFQIVIGFYPIWGFGPLPSGVTDSAIDAWATGIGFWVQSWPFVYQLMTETLVIPAGHYGAGTYVRTTTWQPFADAPYVVDSTGWANDPTIWTPQGYSLGGGGASGSCAGGDGGTYSVVLSNQFNPSTDWAGRTSSALGLCGNVALPPIMTPTGSTGLGFPSGYPPDQNRIQLVVPVTTAFNPAGYVVVDTAYGSTYPSYGFAVLIAAAANGLGIYYTPGANTVDSPFANIVSVMDLASIVDMPAIAAGQNYGGVICLKSRWRLAGTGTGIYDFSTTDTDHKTINGQRMDFTGTNYAGASGQPVLSDVIDPSAFQTANKVSAGGILYTDPVANWPQVVVFNPSDVGANLFSSGASNQYGLLGFRRTPV